ncbi:MAG TPA: energy transducer TonB [Sphingomicrobium sp.]|nr:energy transducer TonB [Sphingomicrobium sp.]
MAYRANLSNSDRGGAVAAVIAIHALLLLALLHLSGKVEVPGAQSVLRVFDLTQPPPPPPPPPPPQQKPQPKPKDKEGGSAPPNIKSQATSIQAPRPKVVVPPAPQIAATETPRLGTQATEGAAPSAGPGTGAGGSGNGTGSGTGGNGPGGGGDNGVAEPPHLVTPVLTGRDFERDMLEQWPRGATVFLRLRVDARGFVSECTIDRGSGVASIDAELCNLAHDRLRFRPALTRSGQAVAGWFGYAQRAPR